MIRTSRNSRTHGIWQRSNVIFYLFCQGIPVKLLDVMAYKQEMFRYNRETRCPYLFCFWTWDTRNISRPYGMNANTAFVSCCYAFPIYAHTHFWNLSCRTQAMHLWSWSKPKHDVLEVGLVECHHLDVPVYSYLSVQAYWSTPSP